MTTPIPPDAKASKQKRNEAKMRAAGYVRFGAWIKPHDKAAVQAFIADLERRHQHQQSKGMA